MSCSTWSIGAVGPLAGDVRDPSKKSNTPAAVRQSTERGGEERGLVLPSGLGVYVHFPWCLAKCPYCDFVSYAAPSDGHGARRETGERDRAYADAVLREIDAREAAAEAAAVLAARSVGSVFFGGGTPSLWEPTELGRVLARILSLPRKGEPETTVECNPTSIDEDRARALYDVGVNRLSIGVQSLSDDRLRFLGRLHDAGGAIAAVQGALRSGIPRVSADLIFGLPGQTPQQACDEAARLVDLGLYHLSCYQLTIEPGTRFGELARRGRLPLAEDSAVADSFLALDEMLSRLGFVHYEISNYARPGHEAAHNVGYWRGNEYLGLGCAAYGFLRSSPAGGVRYRNAIVPERYMSGASHGHGHETEIEPLDPEALMRERIMLGLRTAEGVDLREAEASLGAPAWTPSRERAAAWLVERERIVRSGPDGSLLRVPKSSWLWTDDTAARLF
jgi:oxygen-independent coproporphyrinogen-3 oxidase